MSEEKKQNIHFLGTYFDRDVVLKLTQWARILSWVGAAIYFLAWLVSFGQFLYQLSSGMIYTKGLTFIDLLSYFPPYLLTPLQGVLFFFALQGIAAVMLILMDLEDNTRRNARR
jgi:hypothetical protein